MTRTNELNRDAAQRERDERRLTHDWANDGDCPYCGALKSLIDEGRLKPCFQWDRPYIPEPTDD